jgi:hypothetical protein
MLKNLIVKYFDHPITAFCEFYLERFHPIFLSPMHHASPFYSRCFPWNRNHHQTLPFPQDGMAIYYIGNWEEFDENSYARWHAREYLKRIGKPADIEVVVVKLRRRVADKGKLNAAHADNAIRKTTKAASIKIDVPQPLEVRL